jgi:mediator of RNA polymerase II transcription subunit 17
LTINYTSNQHNKMAPLAFQPWPLEKPEPPNIIDVLARVQVERGQLFRNITESSLQEEIAADGALSPDQSTSEDEDGEGERNEATKNGQPVSREELQRAKFDMMQQVGIAHNEIMMALDFVSLLETEHAPQAQHTMSQALKDSVPPKTLGTDIWAHMPADEAKQAQDRVLARNVKMRSLQRSADDILGAAKRLEDNVRKETQFWDQMLSISGKGWSICRIPRTKRLGVRYGFSESASEFSGRNIAALNSNSDGSISLERGFGSKPTGLRVSVVRDGQVVGKSYLPSTSDDSETTLEARIRHARDSIFDEELFREMTRESRTMSSVGVTMRGQTIRLPTVGDAGSDSAEILLDLVPLDQETGSQINTANPDDAVAQAMALAARLILSQAHREKLNKRSELPLPMADRNEEKAIMSVLKPLISFSLHKSSLRAVNSYIDNLAAVLSLAKVDVTPSHAVFQLPPTARTTNASELVAVLKSTFVSTAHIKLKAPRDEVDITVTVESSPAQTQDMASTFILSVPDEQPLRFDSIEDLAPLIDVAIASSLAAGLRSATDENWNLDKREALLTLEDNSQGEGKHVWVVVNGQEGRLGLSSLQKKLAWKMGQDLPEVGFWDGWATIA